MHASLSRAASPSHIGGWLMVFASAASAQHGADVDEAMHAAFPGARVQSTTCVLDAGQRAEVTRRTGIASVPAIFEVYVARRDGLPVGYAVVDDVRGKSRPITFLAVVGADLRVRRVDIVAYREPRGGEVAEPGWRAQFVGKGLDDPLRVGRDIRNIAGATISCRAVTDGVRRIVGMLSEVDVPRASVGAAGPDRRDDGDTGADRAERSRLLMGTILSITVVGPHAARAAEAALDEVARIEDVLSDWRDDTAMASLNRAAGEPPSACDPTLLSFLGEAQRWAETTGGAVDVTVGPLTRLWRHAAERDVLPSVDELAAARRLVGPGVLVVDEAARVAGLRLAGASIDPGAMGKGWALDRAAASLEQAGVDAALLDFGGQLLAVGERPGGPWPVRLRDTGIDLALAGGSLATTADDQRGRVIEGQRISHVVDPHTGEPARGMRRVTVHAAKATAADALSTALFVMGFEEGVAWAREHQVSARLEARDGRCVETADFGRLHEGEARR